MSFSPNISKTTASGFAPVGVGIATPTPTPAFNFGGAGAGGPANKLSFNFSASPAPGTGFGLSGTPKTQPETTSAITTPAQPTAAVPTPASSAAVSFSGTTATAATTAPGFALNFSTPAPTSTATATSTVAAVLPITSVATTTSAALTNTPTPVNFVQLEESINKWTLDLEEQEKTFMNQAAQINTWDHFLSKNSEKIVALNSDVENVKLEQKKLDHELDFILAQQKELEDCLVPLEKDLASNNAVRDPQRENMYQLAENLDVQLKQMSEDLKEIIEHLNDSNRSQDNSDPIVQIGRILNSHMNSLQWIEQNTLQIQNQLDDVSKLQSIYQKDSDHMF